MSDAINPDHYKRLPAEAIEIVESAIDKAPTNRDAYLHGQVLKYILRCWNKNGIEDLKKAKWYLDRLIDSFDEPEKPKPTVEVTVEVTGEAKPPDGWRSLEVGEVIRKGDRYFDGNKWKDRDWAVKETYSLMHQKTIRRNRFEVGEKVVRLSEHCKVYEVQVRAGGEFVMLESFDSPVNVNELAPYIEDAK